MTPFLRPFLTLPEPTNRIARDHGAPPKGRVTCQDGDEVFTLARYGKFWTGDLVYSPQRKVYVVTWADETRTTAAAFRVY